MRIKTSITLAPQTIAALEEMKNDGLSRSRIIEVAVADLLVRHRRRKRDASDREILDRRAKVLNREVEDVLGFQTDL